MWPVSGKRQGFRSIEPLRIQDVRGNGHGRLPHLRRQRLGPGASDPGSGPSSSHSGFAWDGPAVQVPRRVWLFAILGAFVGGSSPPFGLNGLFGAVLGLLVFALVGGFAFHFRIGRILLTILGIGFVGMFVVALVMAALR